MRPKAKSSWSFFSIIVGSSKTEAKLSENMKVLRPLYLSFALNRKTIERWICRLLGYYVSRFAQALGFSNEGELISKVLEALSSLNLMNVLGLGRAEKHGKSQMN